jgi:hypothetical protein
VDGRYGTSRDYIWCVCVPIKCEKCSEEMQQLTQGLTNYEWYKDYYCPVCKRTVVKLDKDQKNNRSQIIEMERNY